MSSSVLSTVIVYIAEGLTILPLNAVLAVSILLNKSMRQRKELVFIVGLAISDALYGVGCAEYGRDELFNSYLSNASSESATPWSCFLKPREWLLNYAYQVSMLIMCSISAERLISVVSFHKYAKIQYNNHLYVLLAAYTLPFITIIAAGYESYTTTKEGVLFSNDCQSYSYVYNTILSLVMLSMGIGNVLLYASVLIAYKAKVSPAAMQANTSIVQQSIRNKRLTHTLALITGCMLVFYCLPLIAARILTKFYIYSYLLYIYMFMPLQYIAHVLVFYWRQKEIRESVKDFICCNAKKKTTTVTAVFLTQNSAPVRRSTMGNN